MRDPVIRTVPRFADLNINGHIFGGWILSQMDIAGGITAAKRAEGRVATVAIEGMKFLRPVIIGDIVSIYTDVLKAGTTSLHIQVEVMARRRALPDGEAKVTEGVFIFVAIDEDGKKRPIPT